MILLRKRLHSMGSPAAHSGVGGGVPSARRFSSPLQIRNVTISLQRGQYVPPEPEGDYDALMVGNFNLRVGTHRLVPPPL